MNKKTWDEVMFSLAFLPFQYVLTKTLDNFHQHPFPFIIPNDQIAFHSLYDNYYVSFETKKYQPLKR